MNEVHIKKYIFERNLVNRVEFVMLLRSNIGNTRNLILKIDQSFGFGTPSILMIYQNNDQTNKSLNGLSKQKITSNKDKNTYQKSYKRGNRLLTIVRTQIKIQLIGAVLPSRLECRSRMNDTFLSQIMYFSNISYYIN